MVRESGGRQFFSVWGLEGIREVRCLMSIVRMAWMRDDNYAEVGREGEDEEPLLS